MKKFYLLVLLTTLFHVSFSAPVVGATSNGNWNATSTRDLNGKAVYTFIKSPKSETPSMGEIKIGGISNKVLLQFSQEIKGNLTVRLVSKNGQVLEQQIINNPVGQVVVNSKFTGNYIISVSNGQDINTAKQVIL